MLLPQLHDSSWICLRVPAAPFQRLPLGSTWTGLSQLTYFPARPLTCWRTTIFTSSANCAPAALSG